jgi:RNA polymerase primary sigma factor
MYLKQMGQVPLLTREQEVEISKRIETAETHVRQIINNFGFTAKEHLNLAKRLLNGKERFDRVIVDKKIDSRERYMKALPKLCTLVLKADELTDAKFDKTTRSGLNKRETEKLRRDFKKSDASLQRLFDKFYFKQKVLEEFVERANEVREKFDETLEELEKLERVRKSSSVEVEVRNQDRKLKRLELTGRAFQPAATVPHHLSTPQC